MSSANVSGVGWPTTSAVRMKMCIRDSHESIGSGLRTLLRCNDAGGIGGVNGDDFGAVHLVGHDDRNAFAVKRLHGKAAVLHDMIEIILHVGTEVQRRERPLA